MLIVTIVLFYVTAPAQFIGPATAVSTGNGSVHLPGSVNSTIFQILRFFGFGSDDGEKRAKPKASPAVESEGEASNGQRIPDTEIAASALPCSPSGNPVILVPGTYPTIQQAIDNADPLGGDTIQVAAGTYTQQLVINKCVFIVGAGQGSTTIKSPAVLATSSIPAIGANRASIVEVTSNSTISMSDLTVAGPVPFSAPGVSGIFVVGNAALKLTNVRVTAIHQTSGIDGTQKGNAIVAGSTLYNQVGSLDLTNVTVDNYQKTGIIVDRLASSLTMTNTTVTGIGNTNIIAQNGVQVGRRASATISNSTISDNKYFDPNSWVSVGLLFFNSTSTTVSGTSLSGNDVGLYSYLFTADPAGAPTPTSPTLTASSNVISNNPSWGVIFETAATTLTDNNITGSNTGIGGYPVNGQSVNIRRNSITNPIGVGSVGIDIDDWDTGSPTVSASIVVDFNEISGNATGLANNTASGIVAENNFWGCNSGPGNAGCDTVNGTGASDFSPWLHLSGIQASPSSLNYNGTSSISGVSLRLNSDSVDTYSPGNHIRNGIVLAYSTAPGTAGSVNLGSTTFVNGLASTGTTFTAGAGPFVGNQIEVVSATVDNQSDSTNITVVDTTAPTVNLVANGPNPTNVSPISFTATFSEPVSGFLPTGVSLSGTTAPGASVSSVTQIAPNDGTTWQIDVSGMTGSGNISATVNAGAASDTASPANPNAVSTTASVGYFTGSLELVVDDLSINCLGNGAPVYSSIQAAITAASPGFTIRVCPGTYPEDVTVSKSLTIVGVAGAATTIIEGPIGGGGATVYFGAGNVDFSGFTITRAGNNSNDWSNNNLNVAGISMNAGTGANNIVHDNIVIGNRNGLDINNTGSNAQVFRNNVIDNNRTGAILRNQTDNVTFVENSISDNHTLGVVFLDASGGSNSPIQTAKNSAFVNNKISGNWYGQVVDRQAGGSLPAPGTTNLKNFQGNWYGTSTPVVTTANSAEPGYSLGTCPGFYPGCSGPSSAPGGQPDIAGPASANIRYNLPLTSGTDTNVETTAGRGTFGFQGTPTEVDTASANGWYFLDDFPGTGTGSGEFENGPAGTPLGTGNARLSVDSNGRHILATEAYQGIRLDRISSLKYSSYQLSGNPAAAPSFQFDVDNDLDDGTITGYQGRLVYEPTYDPSNPPVTQGTWQTWDLMSPTAIFWGSGSGPNRPFSNLCPQGNTVCTLAYIKANFPNIGLRVAPTNRMMFKAGGPNGSNFTGYVDNFEIGISTGETVFDFEGDGMPNPTVASSVRANANPTSSASVDFTVTFSEPVVNVDISDFALNTTGTITGASVVSAVPVAGAPSTVWTVTVNTGSGSGDIRLDVDADLPGDIADVAGNDLLTDLIAGESYTVDRDPVSVSVEQAGGQNDPTNVLPINFTVEFSENVTGFDNPATDILLGGVATAASITPIDGDTYTVSVTATSGTGFVTVSVPASAAEDNIGNDNAASTSFDNSVNYTSGSSVLMVDSDGLATDGNCSSGIPNTAFTTIQAAVAAAASGNTIKVCPGGAGPYTVSNQVALNVSGLTIVAAEATKPLINVSHSGVGINGENFMVTASGITLQNLHIFKSDAVYPHNFIGVQGTNFTADNNLLDGPDWSLTDSVSRAFVVSTVATGVTLTNNTIDKLRQPAYFSGDGTTVLGTVSNNVVTGTKGFVLEKALVNFSGNSFGITCSLCNSDIALLNYPDAGYQAHYGDRLALSAANDNALIDVQFTAANDSGRAVSYVDANAPLAPIPTNGDGRIGSPHKTITRAIFEGGQSSAFPDGTLPGGTVYVAAGTYTEQITVDRALDIRGAQYGVSPATRTNPANESIIRAAVGDLDPFDGSDDENSVMVTLTADGVKLNGFTIDGDNPSIDSNYELNGADVDAYGGISGNGNINPAADISYNIVKNQGEFGIQIYGDANASGVRTNSNISNNLVDNVVGWWYGNAILAADNASTNVTSNVVTQSFGGVMIHHFNGQVTSRPTSVVSNNTITAFGYPIWFNLHYAYSGNGYTVSNNTINSYIEQDAITLVARGKNSKFEGTKESGFKRPRRVSENEPENSVGSWGRWIGIKIESVNGVVPATFSGNNIDGNRALLLGDAPPYTMIDGIRVTNPSTTSTNIDITGNNITDTNRGIAHTADALIDVTCNNIYSNQIGVYIGNGTDYDGNPESADAGATVYNNNILGNAVFGVQAETGSSSVNNASGNYWGAADGPGPIGPGTGDKVSSLVDFSGFLAIPSNCSPVAPPPTVAIDQIGPDPTNSSPINFTVVFSETVTDFGTGDVTIGGTAGATTAVVTGSGTTYNVAVSGMANDGTVTATIAAGATTTGASGPNVASTSTDNTVTYDTVAPSVTVEQSVLPQTDPTSVSPVNFTVTFSEPVSGFSASDVSLAGSTVGGPLTVTVTGSGPVYNIAVSGMNADGTVVASVVNGAATDGAGNPSTVSTSVDNIVSFNVTANPNVLVYPSTAPGQLWGYYDDVTNSPIATYDFVLGPATAPLSIGSARIASPASGPGSLKLFGTTQFNGKRLDELSQMTYSGYLATGSTGGMPTLQFNVDFDLTDGNTGYQGRVVYVPSQNGTVLNDTWQVWDATNANALFWYAPTFSPYPTECTQAVPCTRSQMLSAHPNMGIHATLGGLFFRVEQGSNANVDNFTVGVNSVETTFDFEPSTPTTTLAYVGVNNPTNENPLLFTVTFGEPVTGFDGSDISFAGTTTIGTPAANVTGGPTIYNVSVTGMSGVGNVVVGVPAAAANGLNSGVPTTASAPVTVAVNYDGDVPTVTISQDGLPQTDPTNVSPINFSVVFSEPVTGFATGDVQFNGSTAGGPLVGTITGSGTTYNVAVTGMSAPGTVVATIPAGVAFDAVNNGNAAATYTDNIVNWVGNTTTFVVDDDGFATAADCDAGTPNTAYSTIQSAIDAASVGNTIRVCPGTYAERLIIDKQLSLEGPNYGVAGTAVRVAEAIVAPPTSDPTDEDNFIVGVKASGVVFDGFTVDGDNQLLSTVNSRSFNGANIDATIGIDSLDASNKGIWSIPGAGHNNPNVTIQNNIVKNLGEVGIAVLGNNATGNVNSNVSNNLIDNIPGISYGGGVYLGNNGWANVTGNTLYRVRYGVVIENMNRDSSGPNPSISNNQISTRGLGIRPNLAYTFTGTNLQIVGNTITSYVDASSGVIATAKWRGIRIESWQAGVPLTVSGNTISPNRSSLESASYDRIDGIWLTNTSTVSANIAISNNTISNALRGISQTTPATPTVTCNSIFNNDVGIYVGHDIQFGNTTESYGSGGINASQNNLVGNITYGVHKDTSAGLPIVVPIGNVNVAGNYWGSADGPGPVAFGLGDKVSAGVDNYAGPYAFNGCAPAVAYPTVTIDQAIAQADPTNGSTINFTIMFSESVIGFTASNVRLGGTAGANTAVVTGSGNTYNIAVSGMTGSGTVIADIYSGGGVNGSGIPSVASTSTDNVVTYDVSSPTVSSIVRANPNPTNAATVDFTVTFSESVTGADITDFSPIIGGGVSGASVSGVSGSGTVYTVSVNTGSGSGTLGLNLVDDNSIIDTSNNPLGGPIPGDGNTTGEVYTIDKAAPTVVTTGVTSGPTNNPSITFLASFNEVVSGFTQSDLTGSVGNGTIASFTDNNDQTYTIVVTAAGDGAVTLYVPANSATDPAGNGNIVSNSASVTYDSTAPTVVVTGVDDPDNNGSPVEFTATFSEPVTGFAANDVVVTGTAFTSGTPVVTIGGAGPVYSISVTGMNQSGTVIASIAGGTVVDLAGNANTANTGDNNVQFNLSNTNVLVSPANQNGWTPFTSDPTAVVSFRTGPATPPLSSGSVQFDTGADGDQYGIIRHYGYDGTPLGSLTALDYSTITQSVSSTGQAPYIVLNIDYDGDSVAEDRLYFEPTYQTGGYTIQPLDGGTVPNQCGVIPNCVSNGTWQSWNALAGGWWSLNDGGGPPLRTIAGYLAQHPNARIVNEVPGPRSGIYVVAGAGAPDWNNFKGNVDKFVIGVSSNNTTYDFEAAPPTVSVVAASGPEGGTASFAVTLTGDTVGRTLPVSVRFQTSDGSATLAGGDYIAIDQIVTLAPGTSSVNVPVSLNDDVIAEGSETFTVTLSEAVNAGVTGLPATGTITDSSAYISISGAITKYTGGGGLANVTVALDGTGIAPGTTTITDANGLYSFNTGVAVNGDYSVTPTCPVNPTCVNYVLDPSSREYINQSGNVTNANFVGYIGDNPRDVVIANTFQTPVLPGQPTGVGADITVPIQVSSQGNENSLNFSLVYDSTKLQFLSAVCAPSLLPLGCTITGPVGPSNSPTTLVLNLGFGNALPVSPSPSTIMLATFKATPGASTSTPLSFSATPGARSVNNIDGIFVPADWINGVITFATGFEADIAGGTPASSGIPNGTITSGDVTRIQNLVAGLATANPNVNEFQRADSAPYTSRGNGILTSGDVTVAQRYANGDLIGVHNPAAGPTAPIGPRPPGPASETKDRRDGLLALGDIRVVNANGSPGTNVDVDIELDGRGLERGFSFTLNFDQTRMSVVSVTEGFSTSGPAHDFIPNLSQVASGRIGILYNLTAPGATLTPVGIKHLIRVKFAISGSSPLGPTPVTFSSLVAAQDVNDLAGDPLDTQWIDGVVNIALAPTSAGVGIGGVVKSQLGNPVSNVQMTIANGDTVVAYAMTNAFGYYRFEGLPAGITYVITANSKRFRFAQRIISAGTDLTNIDFVAEP